MYVLSLVTKAKESQLELLQVDTV